MEICEKTFKPMSGWFPLFVMLVLPVAGIACFFYAGSNEQTIAGATFALAIISGVVLLIASLLTLFGFMAVAPNDARVCLLFGDYKGSVVESGFYWVNPFYSKKKVSRRVRNFETGTITTAEKKNDLGHVVQVATRSASKPSKVNDRDGNPVDISAVVVWKVVETAEALFEVDDYEHFVEVQSEAALRVLASRHPYDGDENEVSLRGNTVEVCEQLKTDIQERLDKAGVEVIEARISHLAYSPEIAAAMLQRQQAQAVVAARTKIVEGAVGMVEMALAQLKADNIVELDEERKAAMVSNLLVVLCSDRHTQPVVNTGSLYN